MDYTGRRLLKTLRMNEIFGFFCLFVLNQLLRFTLIGWIKNQHATPYLNPMTSLAAT